MIGIIVLFLVTFMVCCLHFLCFDFIGLKEDVFSDFVVEKSKGLRVDELSKHCILVFNTLKVNDY